MSRRTAVVVLSVWSLGLGGGCRVVDDSLTYEFTGRLVDAGSGQPISHTLTAVEDTDFNPHLKGDDWNGLSRTGPAGEFTDRCTTAPVWRYVELFGFIPLSRSTAPLPPPMHEAYLVVKREGQWVKCKLAIGQDQQREATPGRRRIALGVLRVPRPPPPTTAPTPTQPTRR